MQHFRNVCAAKLAVITLIIWRYIAFQFHFFKFILDALPSLRRSAKSLTSQQRLCRAYFFSPCLNCSMLTISFTPLLFSKCSLISIPKKSGCLNDLIFFISSGPISPLKKKGFSILLFFNKDQSNDFSFASNR